MIHVSTVRPVSITGGHLAIVANTRETKGKVISTANRLRAIQIPEFDLNALPSKFAVFVSSMLESVARAQLATIWQKEGSNLREVSASLFTVDSLLAFASLEAESKRLTKTSVLAAISDFLLTLKESSRLLASGIVASMAAPAKTGNEKQCAALAAKLETWLEQNDDSIDDTTKTILFSVTAKLLERANELKAQRLAWQSTDELDFSEDN